MASKSKLPVFDIKEKSYERYRFEVECWQHATDLDKKKQGIEVLLSLPESSKDETKVREYIYSKMKREDLVAEDGLKTLLTHMDEYLKEDDLGRVWTRFVTFDETKRKEGQSINEYITKFDMAVSALTAVDVNLPEAVKALLLIRRAGIASDSVKLCLTGLNYADPTKLYKQAIAALRKYASDGDSLVYGPGSYGTGTMMNTLATPRVQVKQEVQEVTSEVMKVQTGRNWRPYEAKRGNWRGRGGYNKDRSGWSKPYSEGGRERFTRGSGGRVNYKNRNGEPARCHGCGSVFHFLRDCPDKDRTHSVNAVEQEEQEECSFVLYTGAVEVLMTELRKDAENCAVLDSACTSTVCGRKWLDRYLSSLSPQEREGALRKEQSTERFRFGGGEVLKSEGRFNLPAILAGKRVTIVTDVVDSDIPLLLSLDTMKRAEVKLFTSDDSAEIFGVKVSLNFTTSGHYCVSLRGEEKVPVSTLQEAFKVEIRGNEGEMMKKLRHLHRQFGHPCTNKLVVLLKNANAWESKFQKMLEEIYKECETCKIYKRGVQKPVVSLPIAQKFNQVVTMDLKKWKSWWIIYFIDAFSRLCVARRIRNKQPSSVVQAFMEAWVGSGYGKPDSFHMDNGGEFTGEEVMEMASKLGVKVNTTAANSPFSNGLCERNHAVVDCMLEKLQHEHPSVPFETLLSWACTVKNYMSMHAGYSPYQIVFGRNPSLPGFEDEHALPALTPPKGKTLLEHLKVLETSRSAFTEADSSERIKRALSHKIRVVERDYVHGDIVYYKRDNHDAWVGPAKVLFQDGKVVFVRHGSYMVKVYKNRLVIKGEEYGPKSIVTHGNVPEESESKKECDKLNSVDVESDEEISVEVRESDKEGGKQDGSDNGAESQETDIEVEESSVNSKPDWRKIKVNDKIEYRETGQDVWTRCLVLGRRGKVNGSKAGWVNVETESDRFSVDLKQVEFKKVQDSIVEMEKEQIREDMRQSSLENMRQSQLENDDELIEPVAGDVMVCSKDKIVWKANKCDREEQAKLEEIEKLQQFNTYEVVDDVGQDRITTRWVITEKDDGRKKARLVARGFEENAQIQSDSPTVGKSLIRVFFSICTMLGWMVNTIDIKSAYLQGKELERDLFLKPPNGFESKDKLWKLKKCLYGLNDGARNFYLSVKECLKACGCVVSNLEPAIFVYKRENRVKGLILAHVDDFLYAGDSDFKRDVIDILIRRYEASRKATGNFKYVGFNVTQTQGTVTVDQYDYAREIDTEGWRKPQGGDRDLTTQEYKLYRRLVGKMSWLANGSRPDIAFSMIRLSTKFSHACVSDLAAAVKLAKRVKTEDVCNYFPRLTDLEQARFVVYTDASLGNLNGCDSCGGHVVFMVDKQDRSAVIAWHSGKLKRVARSTLAAETMALVNGIDEALYLRDFVKFCLGITMPIEAVVDNKSLVQAIASTHLVEEKRLRRDISALKEIVELEHVSVRWVPGKDQLADCLTKEGASSSDLVRVIMGGRLPSWV